jgi:hypothetical protein
MVFVHRISLKARLILRKRLWVKKDEECRVAEWFRRTIYVMVML